jgi:hypothetical protein
MIVICCFSLVYFSKPIVDARFGTRKLWSNTSGVIVRAWKSSQRCLYNAGSMTEERIRALGDIGDKESVLSDELVVHQIIISN